jgi:hypothetical protein
MPAMRLIVRPSIMQAYTVGLAALYVFVAVHTPITLIPGLPHDDGLFMSLGRSLSEGHWLGPFDQFTLMKGPGYPAFLAVGNWAGISVSLARALFHCLAVIFFVSVVARLAPAWIVAVLYALMLWHPISLSGHMLRILRDEIYYAQVLIILAATLLIFRRPLGREHSIGSAAALGAVFGWYWLTREEGAWIIPGLGVIAGVALFWRFRAGRIMELAVPLTVVASVFGLVQLGFGLANRIAYGKFVGVDIKEGNFLAALRAIHSVRSGGTSPFVSITGAGRKRIYAVSPAFATLAPYFEGPGGEGWRLGVCRATSISCDDMASGWFVWALRDAVKTTGHYSSPAAASAFYGQVADEISSACTRGDLDCAPQLIAELPQVTLAQTVSRMAPRYIDALRLLILWNPPLQPGPSGAPDDTFATSLRFLNYPLHTPPNETQGTSVFRGWFYQPQSPSWFSVNAGRPNGSLAGTMSQRIQSPDIGEYFKDPTASNQRFVIRVQCVDPCTVTFEALDAKVERPIASLQAGTDFDVGQGHLHIDMAEIVPDPAYASTFAEIVSGRVRAAILKSYQWIFIPVLSLGAIAFLMSTAIYPAACWRNACYLLAAASWLLAFLRASLLILIDVTTFPALFPFYLAPAYFLLVAAAIASCCAWLQLAGRLAVPLPVPPRRLDNATG